MLEVKGYRISDELFTKGMKNAAPSQGNLRFLFFKYAGEEPIRFQGSEGFER